MKVLLAATPEALERALAEYALTATVEAEYGEAVVEGSVETLAHHGPRAGAPCPCLRPNGRIQVDAIGVSHVDLDTLGGIMALKGVKPTDQWVDPFWRLAAGVDLKGPHRVYDVAEEVDASLDDVELLQAWWAWSESHRCPRPQAGEALDVSAYVAEACQVVEDLIDPQLSCMEQLRGVRYGEAHDRREDLFKAGAEWLSAKEALEASSFVSLVADGLVVLRQAGCFVNHLYGDAVAVVALNTATGAVTLSLADPMEGVNCCAVAQLLWGPLAGGHAGIAGSPRGSALGLEEAKRAAETLGEVIAESRALAEWSKS